jgi:hypothetical protein
MPTPPARKPCTAARVSGSARSGLHGQHGALGRHVEQGVGRQHRRHRVEEQDLVAQQPAVLVVVDVLGDEADQRFEVVVGDGWWPSCCCQDNS